MTTPHNRLEGLDLARAMALLGMVLVNFRIAMGVLAGGPTWLKPLLDALEGRSGPPASWCWPASGWGCRPASWRGRRP
jgi:hypothetical protein